MYHFIYMSARKATLPHTRSHTHFLKQFNSLNFPPFQKGWTLGQLLVVKISWLSSKKVGQTQKEKKA